MKREWDCCILLGKVSSEDQVLLHLECLDAEQSLRWGRYQDSASVGLSLMEDSTVGCFQIHNLQVMRTCTDDLLEEEEAHVALLLLFQNPRKHGSSWRLNRFDRMFVHQ